MPRTVYRIVRSRPPTRSYEIIRLVTVQEIVENGARLELPLSLEVLKVAHVNRIVDTKSESADSKEESVTLARLFRLMNQGRAAGTSLAFGKLKRRPPPWPLTPV